MRLSFAKSDIHPKYSILSDYLALMTLTFLDPLPVLSSDKTATLTFEATVACTALDCSDAEPGNANFELELFADTDAEKNGDNIRIAENDAFDVVHGNMGPSSDLRFVLYLIFV